jgi:glycine/D-amino acid oxidase-like deaminating enzyme
MPPIKDPSAIAEKWKRVVQTRTQDYIDGIESPRADWKTQTLAAAPAQAAGVQAALTAKSFEKGVGRSSTEAWKEGARTKGPGRWAEGIGLSGGKYAANFAPFANVIKSTVLPVRGPVGSTQNYQRSQKMGEALHSAKMQRSS